MERTIIHNEEKQRFETSQDGITAYLRYVPFSGGLDVISTYVPGELEGQGVASALTKHVLEYARRNRLKVIPSCSFTSAYFRRHPEDRDLEVK